VAEGVAVLAVTGGGGGKGAATGAGGGVNVGFHSDAAALNINGLAFGFMILL